MSKLRSLAHSIPGLATAYRGLRRALGLHAAGPARSEVFGEIFHTNAWGSEASYSGTGSDLEQTRVVRRELPRVCDERGIRCLLDVPCGDFHWMQQVALPASTIYLGGDIVAELIEENTRRHDDGSGRRRFLRVDLCAQPLPEADLVLCRDCLVHLSEADIARALANVCRSGATWLLTTTFTGGRDNRDIATGGWRPIDLCAPPFALPPPVELIDEECSEEGGRYADKCLGLWRVADIASALRRRGS